MNELQLKCTEIPLRDFLYSLEYCVAPFVTNSNMFVYNIQLKRHTSCHNNISVFTVSSTKKLCCCDPKFVILVA